MKTKLLVEDLSKDYRSHWTFLKKRGIKDVSFSVEEGECLAILGINGAGKTTTIKCILGLILAEKGKVELNGLNTLKPSSRKIIGFLPEQPYFYQHLTVIETLGFYAELSGIHGSKKKSKIKKVIKELSLESKQSERVGSLSKGQQQRVCIAQVLLNDPEIIILDEPFSGLDPLARVEIRDLFLRLKSEGKTILMSSHILSDIESICDRAIILVNGKVEKEVSIRDTLDDDSAPLKIICSLKSGDLSSSLSDLKTILSNTEFSNIQELSGAFRVDFLNYDEGLRGLNILIEKNYKIIEFSRSQQKLEDIFISISSGK